MAPCVWMLSSFFKFVVFLAHHPVYAIFVLFFPNKKSPTVSPPNKELIEPPLGPSIKYVTLFWPILTPAPPVTLCHIPGPTKVRHTSRTPPILKGLVQKKPEKIPLYKFS